MGEIVNDELNRLSKMARYTQNKERVLSDIATAYISDEFTGVDESLKAVRSMRKALRAKGFSLQEIDDFLIQYSYITKSQIRKTYNDSIYDNNNNLKYVVECIPFHTDSTTTDIIIDELKSRPALLKALHNNCTIRNLEITYNVKNAALLKNFYNKNKSIIED